MKFIISTSGGGGHLFPAIKVAERLRQEGHQILFLGGVKLGISEIKKRNFDCELLNVQGFQGNILERLKFVVTLVKSIFKAIRYLRKYQPDVVVGFGGYGSVPVILAAVFLGYPRLIHEQNVVPGKANKFLAKLVNRIAISFEKSQRFFPLEKTVWTGCPCNIGSKIYNREKVLKEFGLSENTTTIFVLGGSQGSHRINEVFLEAAELLKSTFRFQIIHVCGQRDYKNLKEQYAQLGVPFALFEFLTNIDCAYFISDLIVARAGAATVTEIALSKKQTLFIPYPYAQGHQKENALVLVEKETAQIIEEKDLSAIKLKDAVKSMLENLLSKDELDRRMKDVCFFDADQRLSQQVIQLGS